MPFGSARLDAAHPPRCPQSHRYEAGPLADHPCSPTGRFSYSQGPATLAERAHPRAARGPKSPFLPAGSPQRGSLPKEQPWPVAPRSPRASCRPGTSRAHGAGDCGRSRRRRSPAPSPLLARPEPSQVPPRRACALAAPLAGAGPERATEVTRRALKGTRAAKPHDRILGQEDDSVLSQLATLWERPKAQISESHPSRSWIAQTDPLGTDSALDTRGLASASIL